MKQLSRTVSQVLAYEVSQLGVKGIPNAHWPLTYGNDCLKFQLYSLGVVSRAQMQNDVISIGAFLGATAWPRVRPADLRSGDLVLQQWVGDDDPDHVGMVYSRSATQLRSIEANTSPLPGVALTPSNRGIFQKTRAIDGAPAWLLGGVRPPYAPEAVKVSASKRAEVRLLLAWLDTQLPKSVVRSAAGPTSAGPGDGVMGPLAWLEVQEWGDLVGLYPSPPYAKDGIPGGRSRFVYAEALKRAKAARR